MALLLLLLQAAAAPSVDATPNTFLARGTPTFVVGTGGDARADRATLAQARLVREQLFPQAEIVEDALVLAQRKAGAGWPERPVVYGGPETNLLLAELAPTLPFRLGEGRLELGGRAFTGDGVRLIAVVPAGAEHPEFLLYAGVGQPGVAEINFIPHGGAPLLVADTFGPLVEGRWTRDEAGGVGVAFGTLRQRLSWVEREGAPATDGVRVLFPAVIAEEAGDVELAAAAVAAVTEARRRLGLRAAEGGEVAIHVYPDRGSKASLTSKRGDGHADPEARALHVVRAPEAAFRGLVQHEATHVLAYHAIGPVASPLLGEGLAVWVAGAYAGTPLDEWPARLAVEPAPIELLLGVAFRRLPEAEAYPLAGLFVDAVVDTVGLPALREHLYGAAPDTWRAACEAAGTRADVIQAAFAARVGG